MARKQTLTDRTAELAKVSRAKGGTPEGWRHDGWLGYSHKTGATLSLYGGVFKRPGIGTCYAYDVHEADAMLATGIRYLRQS